MFGKKINKLIGLFFILGLLSLSACFESTTGIGTGLINSAGNDAGILDDSVADDLATPDSRLSAPDDASIPISYLDADEVLIYTPDNEDLIPVTMTTSGFSSSSEDFAFVDNDNDGYADNAYLSVSTEESSFTSAFNDTPARNAFFRNAFAETENTQLCPIAMDGSIECFYDPQNITPTELYFAITDADGVASSDVYWDVVQENLYYVRAEQTDLIASNQGLHTMTNGQSVELSFGESENRWSVQGDHTQNYEAFAATGSRVINDGNLYFVMSEVNGFEAFAYSSGLYTAYTNIYDAPNATAYTVLKSHNLGTYYGIAENTSDNAYLYNILYQTHSSNTYNHILFVDPTENDAFGNPTTHKRTVAFDINTNGVALVIYEDGNNMLRIRASDNNSLIGSLQPLRNNNGTAFDIVDLEFYDDNKAMILDRLNGKLWLTTMNTNQNFVNGNLQNYVTVGNNPVDMTLNDDESRAYVLDQELEKIFVVNLENSDGSKRYQPVVVATVDLGIDGKNLTIDPNAIAFTHDSLFVSSRTTKAILELPLGDIEESAIDDEDYDDDGFTSADGDCEDSIARIHPEAPELCGDELDNNCDGTIDESCDSDDDGFLADDGDCNDTNSAIHPEAKELCDDGIDNDCDGFIDMGDEDCSDENSGLF